MKLSETIKIWTDVRCPWCWIGHRRLGRAVSNSAVAVSIEYKSFLLEPEGPPQAGITVREAALTSWGMSEQTWNARRDNIVQSGAAEMLDIKIDTALTVDSRNAHRLLKLAASRELDVYDAWDAVYARQFEQNDDIGSWDVLRSIAREIGLNDDDVTPLVESDRFSQSVLDDHREAIVHGVRSVPTIRIGSEQATGDLGEEFARLMSFGGTAATR